MTRKPKTIRHIIANIEPVLGKMPQKSANNARFRITNLLRDARLPPCNITPEECKALKSLKMSSDIYVLPADKGRATVILDRVDYDRKLQEMLNDQKTYRKLKKDPAPALERRMNSRLLALRRLNILPKELYDRLRSSGGHTPLLYGLPKVHKTGVPLRPIVSFVNSPTYHLSKYLSRVLSPLVGHSQSAVRNSKDFVDSVKSLVVKSDELLVSFDVVSLFTNVPTDLAIDVARRRLSVDDTLDDRTCLGVDDIISLLELCLDATFLSFRGVFYKQCFGTAMGSPVSVTLANLVMEDIEDRALSTFSPTPRFWKRYMDDTCTVLPSDSINEFHDHLNSVDPNIQFTLEKEEEGSLPFLDVLLSRDSDGAIRTSVFRKPTHTDKYLQFSSHHPLNHKMSVVKTLFSHASLLSTSLLEQSVEESRIVQALKGNGYPTRFIRRSKVVSTHQKSNVDSEVPPKTVNIPYPFRTLSREFLGSWIL